MAEEADMHLELEFDDNALESRGKAGRLRDYMSAFRRNGVWSDKRLAYYQGGPVAADAEIFGRSGRQGALPRVLAPSS